MNRDVWMKDSFQKGKKGYIEKCSNSTKRNRDSEC